MKMFKSKRTSNKIYCINIKKIKNPTFIFELINWGCSNIKYVYSSNENILCLFYHFVKISGFFYEFGNFLKLIFFNIFLYLLCCSPLLVIYFFFSSSGLDFRISLYLFQKVLNFLYFGLLIFFIITVIIRNFIIYHGSINKLWEVLGDVS